MKVIQSRKGFTLIELLIVITIIGVLAVALVPRIVGAPAKARDAARKADLQQIATGLELYYDTNSEYPSGRDCVADIADDLLGSYLTSVPEDPTELDGDGTGTCNGYAYNVTNNGFIISAQLEQATASDGQNIFGSFTVLVGDTTAENITNLQAVTCDGSATACHYYVPR